MSVIFKNTQKNKTKKKEEEYLSNCINIKFKFFKFKIKLSLNTVCDNYTTYTHKHVTKKTSMGNC